MSWGSTNGDGPRPRCQHDLVLHDGVTDLVDLLAPVLHEAAAAGDRVVVVGEPTFVDSVLAAVPDAPGVLAVRERDRARFPDRALRRARYALSRLDPAGPSVQLVSQMSRPTAHEWHEWRRYEAAANVVLAPHRVHLTCAYAAGEVDEAMRADLLASHPFLLTATGHQRSPLSTDLDAHIRSYLDLPPDPVESTAPQLCLADPSAAVARRAVRFLGEALRLPGFAVDAAVLAVSETVTNSALHGRAPVRLAAWARGGRLTVAVSDAGEGPHPLVGLVPVPLDAESGRGMWILHQMLGDVRHRTDSRGYTVRFSVARDGAQQLS